MVKPRISVFHPAPFQRPGKDIGADRGNADRTPAHRTRIVDQQRHHRIAKLDIAFDFVGQSRARRHDDPRQPGGVEHAFFLIEVPAAVLLRHQAPLEPVRELRDDALQAGQLAIEIGAQAVELLRIAQFGRFDFLVEPVGEGGVVKPFGYVGLRAVGAHGRVGSFAVLARFAVLHFLFGRQFAVRIAFAFAFGHLACDLGPLRIGVAFALFVAGLVFLLALVVLAVLVIARIGRIGRTGEIELAQHVERKLLERRLVGEALGQAGELLARPFLDEIANQRHSDRRALRHRFAGQVLAEHQRQSGLQRHFGRIVCPHDRIGRRAHLRRRVEVRLDPAEPVRAQRLVTHLFDRVVTCPRNRFGRSGASMKAGIVVTQLERVAIGETARFGDLVGGQVAARQGHAEPVAAGARHVGAPRDFDFGIARNRPRGACQRLFEDIEWGFVRHQGRR